MPKINFFTAEIAKIAELIFWIKKVFFQSFSAPFAVKCIFVRI